MSSVSESFKDVADNWRSWHPQYADEAFAAAQTRLGQAIAAWDLQQVKRLPGGAASLVCQAIVGDKEAVLKVNLVMPGVASEGEGRALRVWAQTRAVPTVLAERDHGQTLLLEKIVPGTVLTEAGLDVETQLTIVGALARRLHAVDCGGHVFTELSESENGRAWQRSLPDNTKEGLCLRQMLAWEGPSVLLHNDINTGNVLWDGKSWRAIDPKPACGDPHAENWCLLECVHSLPEDHEEACALAQKWLRAYAQATALDEERLRSWVRIRALAEANGSWNSPTMISDFRKAIWAYSL